MADVGEEYKMTEAERFTFDLSGFLVRPAIITCAHPNPTPSSVCWRQLPAPHAAPLGHKPQSLSV